MTYDQSATKEQIDIICQEKGLDPSEIIKAIENSIASAYRKEFGDRDKAYESKFDLQTGKYTVYEVHFIVDEVLNPSQQITLMEARLKNPSANIGDTIKIELDTDKDLGFGRIASQIAKQVLLQSINNARHSKILQKFKNKIGDIVTVEVDYFHKGGYQVKLDQTFGFISKENILPVDRFKSGTLIKALVVNIEDDHRGNSKMLLSRSHPDFVRAIIKNEIPEVESGMVTIDKIVREAGTRTKILVSSVEDDIDPVGAILGKKNMRIINILRQISMTMSEKLDIIENQPDDLEIMVMDALEPAEIERVEFLEDGKSVNIYCYREEAALAVGRGGSNIRLAGQLLDLDLNIVNLAEDGSVEKWDGIKTSKDSFKLTDETDE